MAAFRNLVVDDLERLLVGPGLGMPGPSGTHDDEEIEGRLSLAYMMGMLFPREAKDDSDLGGDEAVEVEEEDPDDPLSMASALLPSSMGLSVCLDSGSTIEVIIKGARYEPIPPKQDEEEPSTTGKEDDGAEATETEALPSVEEGDAEAKVAEPSQAGGKKKKKEERWRRVPLPETKIVVNEQGLNTTPALDDRAALEVLARRLQDGSSLLTLSVSNVAFAKSQRSAAETLYQVSITVRPIRGKILQYPSASFVPPTEDERELRVIYGDQRPYAAGHGVATDWSLESEKCVRVSTKALPTAHVWRPDFENLVADFDGEKRPFEDKDLFDISKLASGELSPPELCTRLIGLVDFYESWIEGQCKIAVEPGLEEDAGRMIDRCRQSAQRMRDGIKLLEIDEDVARCFSLANRAMLMSMAHAERISGRSREDKVQGPFELGEADTDPIDYFAKRYKWRPFQLAFFLQVLPSLAGKGLPDRDLVDVIWFATGGGKTEAYLLVSAFELLHRRIREGDRGGGTGVINRYTYRFLTADQFQRTAGMICALELLRRELAAEGDDSLCEEQFTVGLFAGEGVCPNTFDQANEKVLELHEAREPRAANPFPVESCPCCGTLLVPETERKLPDGSPDLAYYGFKAAANSFSTFCPEEDCDFHSGLPLHFVDDQLYAHPPSFLLGVIDKFAMIPWNEKGGRLLGVRTGKSSPSLIIQDELHLISGPLGTLAGIYEAGFEAVIRSTGSERPKVIASTATIRNAATQCRRIYGRPSAVFPAPGLKAEDSFFSSLDVGNFARSRLYIGLMGQGLRSTISASWAMAATLQSIYELNSQGKATEDELDAYWTLVAYHNSKRELGRIANATRDEIPTRLKVYASNQSVERPSHFEVLELKAHSETPVPQARQMLSRRHSPDHPAIDVVPCTNIISVGVDIDRLGLMLVNGQPKLSAEYIQATSRVGRGSVPGLVVTCYSPSKPRDRSHYEFFRDYHERFYSFVEPTSVTPGALPAIDRALHASLVTAVRHGTGLTRNPDAARFDPNNEKVKAVIQILEDRLLAAYEKGREDEERERLSAKLSEKVEAWLGWTNVPGNIKYRFARGQRAPCLLVRYGDKLTDDVGWPTLQSMRHVDREIELESR